MQETKKVGLGRRYLMVLVLTFSSITYLTPYMCYDFYNQFLEAYQLTDGQMGTLMTFFGLTAMPGYFFGGWLADRFNPKKMVVWSCFLTALVSVAVAFTSNFNVLIILYFCYGITGITMNWGAYLKLVRMMGEDDEQGRLFASTDIAYSLFTLFLTYGVLAVTMTILDSTSMGFKGALFIYAVLTVIIGIGINTLIPTRSREEYSKIDSSEDRINFRLLGKVLLMPFTWYLGLFTLGYFIFRSTITYINPYLTDVYGVDIAFATAFAATIRMVALMVMSPVGGYIRDKVLGGRATPIAITGGAGAMISVLILNLIPQAAGLSYAVMIVSTLIMVFACFSSTCLYTPVAEGRIPIAMTGTVMGVASAIGYCSDIWLYNLCGSWLDSMGNAGYANIWYFTAVGGLMMIVMALQLNN
ncbi:MAG TPA: MFS transporter, partial [Anaerovoracaceae bacterium]|nr:MFS transporter [Anaerovoracaceae bacterium]